MVITSVFGPDEPANRDATPAESRRWLRDLGALLALPALWVDHDPTEIVSGLLSVLFGILQVDGAYARFEDAVDEHPLEVWRPSAAQPPAELRPVLAMDRSLPSGIQTTETQTAASVRSRVTSLTLTLPWASGLIVVSSTRADFPTEIETHLLRVAVGQAAIAIHTAQRLAREHAARTVAEEMLRQRTEVLRQIVEDIEPSVASLARRFREATRSVIDGGATGEIGRRGGERPADPGRVEPIDGARLGLLPLSLTRRETEVLGLLAQGLSNKEIAGTMWLSDRTVERHITSLYRKIGVARRSEATAFALRHGVSS